MRKIKRSEFFRTPRNCTILGWRNLCHKASSFRKVFLLNSPQERGKITILSKLELHIILALLICNLCHNANSFQTCRENRLRFTKNNYFKKGLEIKRECYLSSIIACETYFALGFDAMEERIVLAAIKVPRHFTK